MDRRKWQIQNKVHEIIEEKQLLHLYLDKIVNQVNLCSDFLNNPNKLKPKDYTLILKYHLDVLKKIMEINFELECIIDDSPLDQLKSANVFEDFSSIVIKSEESKSQEPPKVVISSEPLELLQELQFNSIPSTSTYIEESECIIGNGVDVEAESSVGEDADIQILKNTLKKFSEKLDLTSMRDFYKKPLSNCTSEYCDKPSISQFQYKVGETNVGFEETTSFDLPEKDTNRMLCSVSQSIANGVSVDLNYENVTENSSGEEYAFDQISHCHIPLVDEHSIVLNKLILDHTNSKDSKSNKEAQHSALEKLNNTKFFDRQAEAVAKMQLVNQPDISLKPTEHRIRNNLETKSKKKKNKKNKCQDIEYYELMTRSAPTIGQDCAFSHVESPNEFYIHIVDEESFQIDTLTQRLNQMFSDTVSAYASKRDAFKAIGSFCVCYVSFYHSWFRAHILNWELDSKLEDVVVQFVDYGDRRRTSFKNLRRLTKELVEIPMLAVRCHLALMYPPNSTHINRLTEWPSATLDAMMDMSGLIYHGTGEKGNIFRIVYVNEEQNSMSMDMYNVRDDQENTVGQILLNLGLAVQIIEDQDQSHPELEEFLEDVDSLEIADNINEAVMGYDPRDEARICRFTKSDGTCYKGKNCKLEHVPLSRDGFTMDTIPVFKQAMYSLTLPALREYVTILITGYKDVCSFFAQIIWKPRNESKYIIDEDLYSLLADMNMSKTVRTYETFKVAPAIGEIIIVKHFSQKCLRAVVREEIMDKDGRPIEYQVFTLDFGEHLNVSLDRLRKIKPHFLQLPFQAVECYLHNHVAREDCDKKIARKFFVDNMYYHNFVVQTMSSVMPLKVAVKTFDGRDIGNMLMEQGFATHRISDKNPADVCSLDLY